MKKLIITLAVAVFAVGCSKEGSGQANSSAPTYLEGTYADKPDSSLALFFTKDGKVSDKRNQPVKYKIEEGIVKFEFHQGLPINFKINSDGSLTDAYEPNKPFILQK